jgi:hypothetical protein
MAEDPLTGAGRPTLHILARPRLRLRTLLLAIAALAVLLAVGVEFLVRGPARRARLRHRDVVAAFDRQARFWASYADEADRSGDWRRDFRAEFQERAAWYADKSRSLWTKGWYRPAEEWSEWDRQRDLDQATLARMLRARDRWHQAHPSERVADLKSPPSW